MGFVLARALRMFPSIRLRAYVFMSNHLHLCVTDERGDLSAFCQQLFGHLAREINELRGREGTVFPRRFSAEEIVDDEAFADRVVYTLLNPADARLVNEYDEWPGLIGWQLFNAKREVKRFNRRAYAIALRRAEPGLEPRREDFIETEVLEVAPLPGLIDGDGEPIDAQVIEREVRKGEAELRKKKPRVLGRQRILAQHFDDRPWKSKHSWRPLCHASTTQMWNACLARVRAFRVRFAAASAKFRAGRLDAIFPDWSHRPSTYVRGLLGAT
jgi:REP element-mobilizing transposase RayT